MQSVRRQASKHCLHPKPHKGWRAVAVVYIDVAAKPSGQQPRTLTLHAARGRAVAVVADDEVRAAAQLLAQLARDVHRELLQVRVHLKPAQSFHRQQSHNTVSLTMPLRQRRP